MDNSDVITIENNTEKEGRTRMDNSDVITIENSDGKLSTREKKRTEKQKKRGKQHSLSISSHSCSAVLVFHGISARRVSRHFINILPRISVTRRKHMHTHTQKKRLKKGSNEKGDLQKTQTASH